MLLLTTNTIPNDIEIEEICGLVQTTTQIKIGGKSSLFSGFGKSATTQDAIDDLQSAIKAYGGNAAIGVSISTSIGAFDNGTFLYVAYLATAIRIKENSRIKG